jgi:putative membrane protein
MWPLFSHVRVWAHDSKAIEKSVQLGDLVLLVLLALAAAMFFIGWRTMIAKSASDTIIDIRRVVAFFLAGIAMLGAVMLHGPSSELAWVHMTQHMLIMMVAAPLLAFSRPAFVMIWSLPESPRKALNTLMRGLHRPLTPLAAFVFQPVLIWLLYALILWVWHWPRFYGAALENRWLHELQHFAFFIGSYLFAKVLLDPVFKRHMSRGVAIIYLFTTSLHASLLGFFMTVATQPWYEEYASTARLRGFSPLEDQQLAGGIMWMPACLTYLVLAVYVFLGWLRESATGTEAAKEWPQKRTEDSKA